MVVAASEIGLRGWRDAISGLFEKVRRQARASQEAFKEPAGPPPNPESARLHKLIHRINDAERRLEESRGYAEKIARLQARVAELEAEALSDEHLTELAKTMAALKRRRYGEAKKRLEAVLNEFTPDWRPWAA